MKGCKTGKLSSNQMHAVPQQSITRPETPSPVLLACLQNALRGHATEWPSPSSKEDEQRFLQYTDERGVQSLLAHRLKERRVWEAWPQQIRDSLEKRAMMDAILARARFDETVRLFEELRRSHLPALVLKGASLAHLIYPQPGLRPACDIDLLVDERNLTDATRILEGLGYQRGTVYEREVMYSRRDGPQITEIVDLHWGVSEAEVVAREFSFEELWTRAISIKGQAMRALGLADSLMLACTHIAQHRQWDRLIWLYDIHLLADRLDDDEVNGFISRCVDKRLASVCRHGLLLATDYYGTDFRSQALLEFVSADRHWQYSEPSAHLLAKRRLLLHDLMLKLRVGDVRSRVRWVLRILRNPTSIRRLDEFRLLQWLNTRQSRTTGKTEGR